MKAITCQVDIGSMTLKSDKSVRFATHTPELTDEQLSALRSLQNTACEMWLKPLEEIPTEVIKVDKELNQKTQGQRIRAILWRLWKQDSEGMDQDQYYKAKTEKYIEFLKEKIEE